MFSQPRPKANHVIGKKFFERLYLVPGLRKIVPRVNCPYAPTTRPFTGQLFLDFRAIFPLNSFGQQDSPSNLAESLYPR